MKSLNGKWENLALQVLDIARNELLLSMRFLDRALWQMKLKAGDQWKVAADGEFLYFNPCYLLVRFKEDPVYADRLWLHILMHNLFDHRYVSSQVDHQLWNLACDICAEGMIASLHLKQLVSPQQNYRIREAENFKSKIHPFTAEKIYRTLIEDPLAPEQLEEWRQLFELDDHRLWYQEDPAAAGAGGKKMQDSRIFESARERDGSAPEEADGGRDRVRAVWKHISGRMESELVSYSRQQGEKTADFVRALVRLNRECVDYEDFLRRFATRSEVMQISREEFDYIFYTYGMQLYEDMPLIEPLEYREDRKIRDFVIVIDTSGSVSGERVQKFLQKTWNVLNSRESFERKFRIHILQCDAEVKKDDLVTNQQKFEDYIRSVEIKGMGGTDFRPAFARVEELRKQNAFTDLKGLLYFTDGLGIFPEKGPDYLTAFVFVDQDSHSYADLPAWAISAVMEGEDLKVYV